MKLSNFSPRFLSILASVFAIGLIGAAVYFGSQNQPATVVGSRETKTQDPELIKLLTPSPLPDKPVEISIGNQPYLGEVNAPILVVEFLDFQCPFCKEFAENIVPEMVEQYVNPGVIKFVIKDYPLPGHQNAVVAAYAANCAWEVGGQEDYFSYHDLLFANQDEWGTSIEERKLFLGYAQDLRMNLDEFTKCYDQDRYQDDVNQDRQEGISLGVDGTPIFFVNGMPYRGVPPTFNAFKAIIEEEL